MLCSLLSSQFVYIYTVFHITWFTSFFTLQTILYLSRLVFHITWFTFLFSHYKQCDMLVDWYLSLLSGHTVINFMSTSFILILQNVCPIRTKYLSDTVFWVAVFWNMSANSWSKVLWDICERFHILTFSEPTTKSMYTKLCSWVVFFLFNILVVLPMRSVTDNC